MWSSVRGAQVSVGAFPSVSMYICLYVCLCLRPVVRRCPSVPFRRSPCIYVSMYVFVFVCLLVHSVYSRDGSYCGAGIYPLPAVVLIHPWCCRNYA